MNRPGFRFACLFRLCGLVATAPPARAQFAQPAATVTGTTQRITYPQVARAGFRRDYRGIPIDDTKAVAAIRTALHAPMRQLEDFREMPLRQVIVKFRDAAGVPITCDTTALVDAGIDLDHMTVTQELAHLQDVSVAAALRLVLHDAGLTWIVRNESLTVTTVEKAAEAAVVVAYPLPRGLCDDGPVEFQSTIDLIQSTVAAQTWDTVGGYGSIRPLEVGGSPMLFVSQTCEVHDEVENVLRRVNEHAFADFEGGRPVLRMHHVADAAKRASLAGSLRDVCHAALTDGADEKASVTVIGESVAIVSKSPEFHALASQVVAAVDGVVQQHPRWTNPNAGGGETMGMNPFCRVAREVYGADDPGWLAFRGWALTESPAWFREAYGRHGAGVADWLRHRPVAKGVVRVWMDAIVRRAVDGG